MKYILFLLVTPLYIFSQTQIGNDIDGEAPFDQSGYSVSLSSDGSIVAIGAFLNDNNGNNSGHVRVYQNNNDIWTQIGNDIDGETLADGSGISVDLSSSGTIVAIGAYRNSGTNGSNSGHVRVYENTNDVWTQIGDDIDGEAANDESGISVSLSNDGSIVAIGAIFNDGNGNASGHVKIFKNENNDWTQIGDDIDGEAENDNSGISVSLSSDGSIVAIGSRGNDANGNNAGHVRVFENDNNVWTQIGQAINGEAAFDESGTSISLSSDGSIVAIGAYRNGSDSGHVRVYKNENQTWTQLGDDIDGEASGDFFGTSVSLSNDGAIVAIGATGNDDGGNASGHVRIYKNESGVWTKVGDDIHGELPSDNSGVSVSMSSDGSIIAIGANANDGNGNNSGHVRFYDLKTTLSVGSATDNYFKMFPNPGTNRIKIQLNPGQNLKQINIYNVDGKYLYSEKDLEFNISRLFKGIYIIEVVTNLGKSTKKLVIY